MARRPLPPRKRRTREHVIADLSVNHVEKQALLAGFTVNEWLHDYGIDLLLSTYNDEGETENGIIFLQLKATDHLKTVQDGRFVSIRIDRVDLRSWLAEAMPVMLIVYDAANDRAYWWYVQAAFPGAHRFRAARGSERLTIRIPSAQILDPAATRRFRDFREAVIEQIQGVIYRHD